MASSLSLPGCYSQQVIDPARTSSSVLSYADCIAACGDLQLATFTTFVAYSVNIVPAANRRFDCYCLTQDDLAVTWSKKNSCATCGFAQRQDKCGVDTIAKVYYLQALPDVTPSNSATSAPSSKIQSTSSESPTTSFEPSSSAPPEHLTTVTRTPVSTTSSTPTDSSSAPPPASARPKTTGGLGFDFTGAPIPTGVLPPPKIGNKPGPPPVARLPANDSERIGMAKALVGVVIAVLLLSVF